MNKFTIENARIETVTNYDMVFFDLVTERGRVELAEHVNYNDGEFEAVERSYSNIEINLEDELSSVFDMSEKPPMMPVADYLPVSEIIDAVETSLRK